MRAHQWLLGLVSVGTVAGMTAAGCGSSSSGPSDAGSDATDDAGPDVCNPQPVTLPDSGTCSACIMSMCSAQYAACNADCTCGPQVNSVATCLANLPPPTDAGGLGALLGPGLQLLTCFGGGGAVGGGGRWRARWRRRAGRWRRTRGHAHQRLRHVPLHELHDRLHCRDRRRPRWGPDLRHRRAGELALTPVRPRQAQRMPPSTRAPGATRATAGPPTHRPRAAPTRRPTSSTSTRASPARSRYLNPGLARRGAGSPRARRGPAVGGCGLPATGPALHARRGDGDRHGDRVARAPSGTSG